LRRSDKYQIVTPEEMIKGCRGLAVGGKVIMHARIGGLTPELGCRSLQLIETKVFLVRREGAD
jgi:hypothetical protein